MIALSSPREPSDSALAAAAVFGSACGSGAARAGAPMHAHVDDLGWESAAEVHAMRELAAALRSRGGGTWAAPTPERIDELYMESIDKVWDWGQGAPTFDSMRVSPAIEVGPFAADDEMHPLVEVCYSHSFVCAIFCLCLLTILLFALYSIVGLFSADRAPSRGARRNAGRGLGRPLLSRCRRRSGARHERDGAHRRGAPASSRIAAVRL